MQRDLACYLRYLKASSASAKVSADEIHGPLSSEIPFNESDCFKYQSVRSKPTIPVLMGHIKGRIVATSPKNSKLHIVKKMVDF